MLNTSTSTNDLRRPRRRHRGDHRERGGQDRDRISELAEVIRRTTRSWRATPRRSRSPGWPSRPRTPSGSSGMHFFNPVDRMELVEVIRGEKTSDETVATIVALAKRIRKTPIVVKRLRRVPGEPRAVPLHERGAPAACRRACRWTRSTRRPRGSACRWARSRCTTWSASTRPSTPGKVLADGLSRPGRADRRSSRRWSRPGGSAQKSGAGLPQARRARGQARGRTRPSRRSSTSTGPASARHRRRRDHRPALPADAPGGDPRPRRGDRPRAGRRRHGPDPRHRLPPLPRRHPPLVPTPTGAGDDPRAPRAATRPSASGSSRPRRLLKHGEDGRDVLSAAQDVGVRDRTASSPPITRLETRARCESTRTNPMRKAVVIDAVRTPIGRASADKGYFRDVRSEDLSAHVDPGAGRADGHRPEADRGRALGLRAAAGRAGFRRRPDRRAGRRPADRDRRA